MITILWGLLDDPGSNVRHIDENGISMDDVEHVLRSPFSVMGVSRSSGRPMAFGATPSGKYIAVVWEEIDDDPRIINPITAYEVEPPQGWRNTPRRGRR